MENVIGGGKEESEGGRGITLGADLLHQGANEGREEGRGEKRGFGC